ncbi:hypothetical protein D3C83_156530 [compost metagenome]
MVSTSMPIEAAFSRSMSTASCGLFRRRSVSGLAIAFDWRALASNASVIFSSAW